MRILVTGGAGFIGTNLIKRLLTDGHEVVSIDNYSTGKRENEQRGCKYFKADITDFYDFRFFTRHADVVFHLAAIARIQPSFERPKDYINTNFQGTYNLVNYCAKQDIPIIYAGTSSHHSGKFKNPYTFSKSLGEDAIKLYQEHFNLKASIVRFYNVYGPHQLTSGGYTTLIGRWIDNIKKGKPCEIYGDGSKRRDFTHVEDIVDGLLAIWNRESYGTIFELGSGKNHSIKEVANMFNISPVYKENKIGEADETLCTDKLAHTILDWRPKNNLRQYIEEIL